MSYEEVYVNNVTNPRHNPRSDSIIVIYFGIWAGRIGKFEITKHLLKIP